MAYSYLDFAEDVLKEAPRPLLPIEIWELGKNLECFSKLNYTGKTPQNSLAARIYVDVRDNQDKTRFIKVTTDPARFYLKELKDKIPSNLNYDEEIDFGQKSKSIKISDAKFNERELHPILAYFAYTNQDFNKGKYIYTKTVFHENSTKKGALNQWIHPDMIGFSLPIEGLPKEVVELNGFTDKDLLQIYSFELKKTIDRSNYRECYFQAVSNSSWSHEGYLVAADIRTEDTELIGELERLSLSFGIGIIYLDLHDIDSSKVLYPAKKRDKLDWKTIAKLANTNKDFKKFIKDVAYDYEKREIHPKEYDQIPDDISAKIEGMLKSKHHK